jgi:hypothetical protein
VAVLLCGSHIGELGNARRLNHNPSSLGVGEIVGTTHALVHDRAEVGQVSAVILSKRHDPGGNGHRNTIVSPKARERASALIVIEEPLTNSSAGDIALPALQNRLPMIGFGPQAEAGALMEYGAKSYGFVFSPPRH